MSRERPSRDLRELVTRRAGRRCEYCLCPLDFSTEENFDIEHILPATLGGLLIASNLALACSGCNGAKGVALLVVDPETQVEAPLYNPRQMSWTEHFAWEGIYLLGHTPTGRGTIARLRLNRPGVLNRRRLLLLVGLHPPQSENEN